LNSLNWFVCDKAREGSAATLVCARFCPYPGGKNSAKGPQPSEPRAWCRLLAIGDSCALKYRGNQLRFSFPYDSAGGFRTVTECFPTKGYHTAWWEAVRQQDISLRQGDVLVLATDAVAKWLLCDSKEVRGERIALLLAQTEQDWPGFVQICRRTGLMEDDDSTALIIKVVDPKGSLPKALEIQERARKKRVEKIKKANNEKDFIAIALLYGDGTSLPTSVKIRAEKLEKYRRRAEGRRKLLGALQRMVATDRVNREELQKLWDQYREVLVEVKSLEPLRNSLVKLGVSVAEPVSPPHELAPPSATGGLDTFSGVPQTSPEAALTTEPERSPAEAQMPVFPSPDAAGSKTEPSLDAERTWLPNESGAQPTIGPSGSAQDIRREEEPSPFADSEETTSSNS